MTVDENDLNRLCAEMNMLDAKHPDDTLDRWLDREDIDRESMKIYLSMSLSTFLDALTSMEDADLSDESERHKFATSFVTQVGQSFRLGWEGHKQYGRSRS
jgi:hypothetical protein